jgi:hypothetical protein
MLMVHQWSAGTDGRPDQMLGHVECQVHNYEALYKSVYRPFLTAAELKSVISHQDLYFGHREIIKRLKKTK